MSLGQYMNSIIGGDTGVRSPQKSYVIKLTYFHASGIHFGIRYGGGTYTTFLTEWASVIDEIKDKFNKSNYPGLSYWSGCSNIDQKYIVCIQSDEHPNATDNLIFPLEYLGKKY